MWFSFVSYWKCQFDFQWPQSGFCSVQFYPSNPIRFDFRWNSSLRSQRYFICILELKSDLKQGILWPQCPAKCDSLYNISKIQFKSRIVKISQTLFSHSTAQETFEKNQNSITPLNLWLVNTRAFDLFFFSQNWLWTPIKQVVHWLQEKVCLNIKFCLPLFSKVKGVRSKVPSSNLQASISQPKSSNMNFCLYQVGKYNLALIE